MPFYIMVLSLVIAVRGEYFDAYWKLDDTVVTLLEEVTRHGQLEDVCLLRRCDVCSGRNVDQSFRGAYCRHC